MTIQTWLKQSTERLKAAGIKSAHLDAHLLLEHSLNQSKSWIVAHDDQSLDVSSLENLNTNLTLRINHTPLAYILGSKEFYGRDFLVTQHVLVPRPESEILITLCKNVPHAKKYDWVILDIGTGSGILAITAELEIPESTVYATDISKEALGVAQQNAHALNSSVQFILADLLDLPEIINPDVILANLPYVPDGLITSKEIEAEPKIALFSGDDGLDHYRRFWDQIGNLKPTYVITECLESQHDSMKHLAQAAHYNLVKTLDLGQLFIRSDE